ncbi:MAG: S8 family serine peptidase [Xanthomonadales bacterium]|nr:S8 family serine peptidase [Xanthomonadales bacterium]
MKRRSPWPARRSLALASMALFLGGISHDADAVDKMTRDRHAGRVFFPAEGSTQTYDSFIVYLRDDAKAGDDGSAKALAARSRLDSLLDAASQPLGLSLRADRRISTGGHLLRVEGDALGAGAADRLLLALARDPQVASIEPNIRLHALALPNDPFLSYQWPILEATGGINVEPAWDSGADGLGVVIAVIDTGQTYHPDLDNGQPFPNNKTLPGIDMISDPANARDGNGRDNDPSDMGDWNTANQCGPDSPAHDSTWHGTHVAGIAAALTNNTEGVAGVAYNSYLQHVRVLGTCGGSTADIADGIVWASGGTVSGIPDNATPAHVLNLSLGGQSACSTTYQTAINTARANGSVLIVAAGNSNAPTQFFTPANCNGVIAVASSRRDGGRASYSNFDPTIDIAAPGGDSDVAPANGIASTVNTGTTTPLAAGYNYKDGTSMAAPQVAGVAALMIGENSSLTPDQIETLLIDTARPFPVPCTLGCGSGIVDANAAVAAATGGTITNMPMSVALYGFGHGSVTSSPAGINCGTQSGTSCSTRYATNATVTLQANAAPGFTFSSWFGPCSNSSPTCVVSMQHAAEVHALFEAPITALSNGVQTGSFGTTGETPRYFAIDVPSGASNLDISISGGSGDADLYVRHGNIPDENHWECRPFLSGNNESCTSATPAAGTWYIMVVGAPDFSGTRLTASFATGSGQWIFCSGMEDGDACPAP